MRRAVLHTPIALTAWLCAGAAVAQPAVLRAAARACTSAAPPVSVAGPWPRGDTTYTAAVFWREGATRACLALVAQRPGAVTVLARGSISAGWSDRYGERYAPWLRDGAIWLPGLPPLPIVETMQMGAGGGGGHLTSLLRAARGRWESVFAETLDGVTNINAEVETPCEGRAPIVQDGALLRVTECFDGRSTERVVRFDGRRFVAAPRLDDDPGRSDGARTREATVSRPATDAATPADATATDAPAAPIDREVASGMAVFFRVCGPCHAAMWRVPSGGTLAPARRPEAEVRRQIRHGSGEDGGRTMPPIGPDALPEADLTTLLAYLRSTRVVGP